MTSGASAFGAFGQADGWYGLIGKMTAVAGRRDELIAVLLNGVSGMPGCLSYVVATDPADADAIWITEVWDSAGSHTASLSMPSAQRRTPGAPHGRDGQARGTLAHRAPARHQRAHEVMTGQASYCIIAMKPMSMWNC